MYRDDASMTLHRRHLLLCLAGLVSSPTIAEGRPNETQTALRRLEASVSGRLGVFARTSDGRPILQYRADERFAMCSTFKFSLAGAVLARVDQGRMALTQLLPVSQADILPNSATTETHLAAGAISVADACAAAIQFSDNAAANLLIAAIGGPPALTRFWRRLGDRVSRLDRYEPGLNEGRPGDPRDTTSPRAMAQSMAALLFGDALSSPSRSQLMAWLVRSRTGLARLRAGVPNNWRAADKTGTGPNGSANDIATFAPLLGAQIIVTCFLTQTDADLPTREAVHAQVGRLVAAIPQSAWPISAGAL